MTGMTKMILRDQEEKIITGGDVYAFFGVLTKDYSHIMYTVITQLHCMLCIEHGLEGSDDE